MQICDDVGSLPGRWHAQKWQPLDAECQLEDWPEIYPDSKLQIFLFGDSVDRYTAFDVALANDSVCCVNNNFSTSDFCHSQRPCETMGNSTILLSHAHLNGVWPDGPFLEDERPLSGQEAWRQVVAVRAVP